MKKSFILYLLLSAFSRFALGAAEEVPSRLSERKDQSWYSSQAAEWKAIVDQHPGNNKAWLNYYLATRYANKASEETLYSQIKSMAESFEKELILAFHFEQTDEGYVHTQKANELRKNNFMAQVLMMAHAERLGLENQRKAYAMKVMSQQRIYQSLLSYNYNVLMSIEPNGVLLVDGDNTSIPLWLLQDAMDIRTDVKVVDLNLCKDENYLNSLSSRWQLQTEGLSGLNESEFTQKLPDVNPEFNFFYSLTLDRQYLSEIENQLYVVGLASVRSEKRINNVEEIRTNLEQKFLLDYVSVDFNGEPQTASGRKLTPNYLVPALLLKRYYQSQHLESPQLDAIIEKIARESGRADVVKNFLTVSEPHKPYAAIEIDTKDLEETFKPIRGKLYAQYSEVTNKSYNDFLSYLQEHNMDNLYKKCNYDLSQYEGGGLAMMKSYHEVIDPSKMSKKKEYYTNYPVIDISYEGAVEYCQWLTDQYNQQSIKKFKKVVFRLPTLNEWQIAALGYKGFQSWNLNDVVVTLDSKRNKSNPQTFKVSDHDIIYPWYIYDVEFVKEAINSKGCYLGNFKTSDEITCPNGIHGDGFKMAAKVARYFANDMGLFDVVGNVAEMVSEKGKACGGSWDDIPEKSSIKSVKNYDGPSASIGFRVFMEVIEE
ncbi:formylglycine-generating enzyme family protein [Fulvivirga ligni]|uniref:formylglycine-generating enzyme family protein n=1 Tax=Fulvivirga ligni TaxID=2904246 RepID=UPI001F3A6A37|nr:SUMF1/EgtB/PvdO family nonheme iron enzyme [Fulvivirga ligni]UII19285.1 formylglycine-generating enzyme family protein [Fulvivirga ligni]